VTISPAPKPWQRNSFAVITAGCWIAAFALAPSPWLLSPHAGQLASFLLTVAGMICLFVTFGYAVSDSTLGILLNGRNVYSLSRFQMVLWTVLVLSALMSAAACRAWSQQAALDIRIPGELLAAMGISLVSAAAAPALLSLKSDSTATSAQLMSAEGRLGEPLVPVGKVIGRPAGAPASLADLVRGDELANAGAIDLSKVQQLLITLLLITVYASMVGQFFFDTSFAQKVTDLPGFDQSFVNLMLVSHGGYLAYKATSKPDDVTPTLLRPSPPDRNGATGA